MVRAAPGKARTTKTQRLGANAELAEDGDEDRQAHEGTEDRDNDGQSVTQRRSDGGRERRERGCVVNGHILFSPPFAESKERGDHDERHTTAVTYGEGLEQLLKHE